MRKRTYGFAGPQGQQEIATPVRAWIRPMKFIPLVLLLFISAPPCAAQQSLTLRKIEFVGLKKLTAPQAIEASGLKVADTVTREAVDAAAEKLMQSGVFKKLEYKLRTADNNATVVFEIEEATRNLPGVFENFVWFTE